MTKRTWLAVIAMSIPMDVLAEPPSAAPAKPSTPNPFFAVSTLPFQAPPFDKITDADYAPAIDEGMKQQLAEMATIAGQAAAPTFDNTVVAMEKSGALLTRVSKVFFGVAQANLNDTLEKLRSDVSPKLAAHNDAIFLNAKLFARMKAIYDGRNSLDPESKYLTERYYRDFVHAGALLSDSDKEKLKALNKEEANLQTDFQNKLLAGTKAAALVISDKTALDGMGEGDLAAAAGAAKDRKLTDKWVIAIQNTTQQPAQQSLTNRATREQLFKASTERTEHGDPNDTRATIQRLAQLRAQKAMLLGFPTWAAYSLDDQMAKVPEHAIKLMTDMVPAATAKARAEAKKMQSLIDKQKGKFKLQAWDWQHYAELVRKAEYDLDQSTIKPYFVLDRVLQDGVFYAAGQLYGLTFKERHDIPTYHPDVRVFDVLDADGKPLAIWMNDYFKRDNKAGGAWEDSFVQQAGLLDFHPVVVNVCNFTKPAPGQPALLSFDDVTTMFHEFGHALHDIFSNVKYPRLSGTNTPRDFVEFPSQFNEHWATEPTVFAHYARHFQTGEPMPADLVERLKKSKTFNQGFATTEYLAAGLLDQAWHTLPADAPLQDVDKFEAVALKKFKVDYAPVPPRYRSSYFAHIWSTGYSASYYAYLWSEVLDDDAYYWFREHGGMNRENGQRFREMILSRGSTHEMDALYKAFRGRDPIVQPLLEERGLAPSGKASKAK